MACGLLASLGLLCLKIHIYIYPVKVVNGLVVPDRALQIPAVAVLESFTGSDDGSSWQSVLQLWPLLFLLFSLQADRFFPWVTIYETRISIVTSTHFDRDVCPENTAGVFVPLQERLFLRDRMRACVGERKCLSVFTLCLCNYVQKWSSCSIVSNYFGPFYYIKIG